MTGVLVKRWPCEDTGRMPCHDEGRDRSDINQGTLKISSKPPEATKRQGRIPLQVSEGGYPC